MPRKFVTGEAKQIVVTKKRETVTVPCQGCGKPMTIGTSHSGDIMCAGCSQGTIYVLKTKKPPIG